MVSDSDVTAPVAPPAGERVGRLQSLMARYGLDAALIMHPRDVYYYAGTGQPSNLWVPVEGEPVLFARRVADWVRRDSHVRIVLEAASVRQMRDLLRERGLLPPTGSVLGIEEDIVPARIVSSILAAFPGIRPMNVSPLVLRQRMVKSEGEITAIREAAGVWSRIHETVLSVLRPGITEAELAGAAYGSMLAAGATPGNSMRRWDGTAAGTAIVASGENGWRISGHAFTVTGVGTSPAIPWGFSTRKIERGDLVVVDFGVLYRGYHGDMCRTYALAPVGERQRALWDRLQELHQAVIAKVEPGVTGRELYELAVTLVSKAGLGDFFMGYGQNQGRYLGHGIGLEIDEPPVLGPAASEPLTPGMVITLEPKFIVPGVGAVMIEDDVLITEWGSEVLGTVEQSLFVIA